MNKKVTPILSTAVIMASALSLCACSTSTKTTTSTTLSPSAMASHGYSKALLDVNNVQVVRIGQTVQVIIPSDLVFHTSSANLQANSKTVLHNIANLIKGYKTNRIKVAAYSDSTVGNGIAQDRAGVALTEAQAQAVSSYLWSQGIDTRYIYSEGYGSADPVASNNTPKGQYQNRRVVISFKFED